QSGPDDRQFFKSGNEVRYIFSGGKYDETDPTSYRILQERDWQREILSYGFLTELFGLGERWFRQGTLFCVGFFQRYQRYCKTDWFTTGGLTCEFVDGLVEDRIGGFVVKRVVEKERYDVG
ncbi:hypothetical protein OBE_05780, partial [human gut metagenome]